VNIDLNNSVEIDTIQWRLKRSTFNTCNCAVGPKEPDNADAHDRRCNYRAAMEAHLLIDAFRARDEKIKALWALLGVATTE
jgi:hypothetical protein